MLAYYGCVSLFGETGLKMSSLLHLDALNIKVLPRRALQRYRFCQVVLTSTCIRGEVLFRGLAGTLPGGQSPHPKQDTNLSLPIPLINSRSLRLLNNCWVQSVKPPSTIK